MRAAWFTEPGRIGVKDLPEPEVVDPGDVVVDILYAGICGSDLWTFRGLVPHGEGGIGHEFIGRVREVGQDVATLSPGDVVIAPFLFSEGGCEECRRGLQPLCAHAGIWGKDWAGAQAEAIRVPYADATLVRLPWPEAEIDDDLARRLIPLCDVFATGTHGVVLAGVESGDTVAVIGDGAVGISAAMAAARAGAARVLLLGERDERLKVAEGAGARTLRVSRDESPVEAVREMLDGRLPDRVVECVGMQAAFDTALDVVRPAGSVGFVGVPHGVGQIAPMRLFGRQVRLAGGVAPARHYLPGLIDDVVGGRLDPSPLIDRVYRIDDLAEGYDEMDRGTALKAILRMT
ncbi:alcohol dehydrogenase catalytic domain-containing protein [Streptosporangium sp. NPDC051022]|uniref:alcohol dehydrogenase catalytic domain-containing protein n=1 Tax=Streptosporangium sp. NPDC051022 TaxID=3155752 RepID=UPI00343EE73B